MVRSNCDPKKPTLLGIHDYWTGVPTTFDLHCSLVCKRCHERSIDESNIYGLLTKCEVKMAGYWPRSFFFACLWTETNSRSINTQKKNTRPIPSHVDRTSLVNKGFIIWLSGIFFFGDNSQSQRRI